MSVGLLKTVWSVTGGGSGLTVMSVVADEGTTTTGEVGAALAAARTFWAAIAARLPNDVSLSFPGPLDIFSLDGTLVGSTPASSVPSAVAGTSGGVYSAPSGAKIIWETGQIVGGRRLRGRSYIVPIAGDQYDADGTLASDFINAVGTAATALRVALATAGLPLTVWSRKNEVEHAAVGQTIRDQAAILRSRRD